MTSDGNSKKTNILSIFNVRKDIEDILKIPLITLKENADDISEIRLEIAEIIKQFIYSDLPMHKVANEIITHETAEDAHKMINSEFKKKALAKIHRTRYELEDIITKIKIDYYPSALTIQGNSESLLKTSKIEAITDSALNKLVSTNAQKEREVEYIMKDHNYYFDKINIEFKMVKNYLVWVEDQIDYANKMDSFIRLNKQLDESLMFGQGGSLEI